MLFISNAKSYVNFHQKRSNFILRVVNKLMASIVMPKQSLNSKCGIIIFIIYSSREHFKSDFKLKAN